MASLLWQRDGLADMLGALSIRPPSSQPPCQPATRAITHALE
ncbi:Uncharacterised protein [Bordetella ansorpii]|uniref:Uncharacterized protein n=1 Tax=Bordetella ansorpii TaxID=288768 RepID=A0A157SDH5_9BORD|nr:hypothetical protein [Bordetella ansorpii]SAI68492.1 Uncharacterised protein [Bordetella ansorpii]